MRISTRSVARLACTVAISVFVLVMTALPAFAQTDGDAYVGPTPPSVAPTAPQVAPAQAEAAVAASAPVTGGLPMTGGDVVGLAAIGAAAIIGGGALVAVRRRHS